MDVILELFKLDLGVTHNLRDEIFNNLLYACRGEIERRGIALDLNRTDDKLLLCDYALWQYRKRNEDVSLPQNIQMRIKNRVMRRRSNAD